MAEPRLEASRFVESIDKVVDCLLSGGVVVLPTDTVYGLAALPACEKAVDRLYALKGRPGDKRLPVMISSEHELETMGVEITALARRLLCSPLMPGALTLALGFAGGQRPSWLAGRMEVAVRIPDCAPLLSVLRRTGPLFVTSANAHGLPTPETVAGVLEQLHGKPDLAIDGGTIRTIPSTLVNCRVEPPIVERAGVIAEAEVWEFLR